MRYIDASYEIIEQEPGIAGIYKQIERAGRTCYKSEDKITDDSAESFVNRMIDSKHYAMLEHGTVYLYFQHNVQDGIDMGDPFDISLNLTLNRFTVHNSNFDTHETFYTTNLRVLVENFPEDWKEILKAHCVDYDDRFIRRPTVKFICNRQVSHEFVRHRVFSFAQESTRYCNYTKDKWAAALNATYLADRVLCPSSAHSFDEKPYLLTSMNVKYSPNDISDITLTINNILDREDNISHTSSHYSATPINWMLSYNYRF